MNDLEWLARHVHEWRGDYEHIGFNRQYKRPEFFNMSFSACHERYTRNQWLAERARLQNKPDWSTAPDWAEWLAQDGDDGGWYWYEEQPCANSREFISAYMIDTAGKKGEILGDFRDTLEPRPEEQTMTKKEWKQDDLPPVGEECEVYRNGEWELCEIIAHIEQPAGTLVVFGYGREPGYGISGVDCLMPRYFRPVDVSRAEKDRAVEDMVNIITKTYTDSKSELPSELPHRDSLEVYLREIYRAGYRKQEPSE